MKLTSVTITATVLAGFAPTSSGFTTINRNSGQVASKSLFGVATTKDMNQNRKFSVCPPIVEPDSGCTCGNLGKCLTCNMAAWKLPSKI